MLVLTVEDTLADITNHARGREFRNFSNTGINTVQPPENLSIKSISAFHIVQIVISKCHEQRIKFTMTLKVVRRSPTKIIPLERVLIMDCSNIC